MPIRGLIKGSMGEGFKGDVHPPLYDFLFLTSFLKIRKRFFASAINIISGIYGSDFSDGWKLVSVAP